MKNGLEVKSVKKNYGRQGPEILSERLTNQNLECEDDDDEVYNADSYKPGTDAI